jgi:starch phosphorylase
VRRMSIISDHPFQAVRMAHLATVASTKVNGVAELHSQLLRDKVLPDFSELWPEKFTNVTNGVTPRRFIKMANPALSAVITEAIGDGWVTDLDELKAWSRMPTTPPSGTRSGRPRTRTRTGSTRCSLAARASSCPRVTSSTSWSSGCTNTSARCSRCCTSSRPTRGSSRARSTPESITPRIVMFGAKAAPGYFMAKEIIYLINRVASVINADPRCSSGWSSPSRPTTT